MLKSGGTLAQKEMPLLCDRERQLGRGTGLLNANDRLAQSRENLLQARHGDQDDAKQNRAAKANGEHRRLHAEAFSE